VEILATEINKILNEYGYKLVMDMIHNEKELEKYEKKEKYFDRKKYLTIKSKDDIVIGRVYSINSLNKLPLNRIKLSDSEIDIILAFFKFFRIKNANVISRKIANLTKTKLGNINVDIIRNNVYKQSID